MSVSLFELVCVSLYFLFFFFFSSRRRHTRCLSDWSSDVCSSDLVVAPLRGEIRRGSPPRASRSHFLPAASLTSRTDSDRSRSEERRVGKECRSRWSAEH